MFKALMKRYDAEIEDALYRIDCINDHNLIIPEHTDILGEVDKMLQKISSEKSGSKIIICRLQHTPWLMIMCTNLR